LGNASPTKLKCEKPPEATGTFLGPLEDEYAHQVPSALIKDGSGKSVEKDWPSICLLSKTAEVTSDGAQRAIIIPIIVVQRIF